MTSRHHDRPAPADAAARSAASLASAPGDSTANGTEEITGIATPTDPCERIRYQTWFADPAEAQAGRWRSAIDELAASANLDETAT